MEITKPIFLLICLILCVLKTNCINSIENNYKAIACLSLSRNALVNEKVTKINYSEISG